MITWRGFHKVISISISASHRRAFPTNHVRPRYYISLLQATSCHYIQPKTVELLSLPCVASRSKCVTRSLISSRQLAKCSPNDQIVAIGSIEEKPQTYTFSRVLSTRPITTFFILLLSLVAKLASRRSRFAVFSLQLLESGKLGANQRPLRSLTMGLPNSIPARK